jgi:sec-independent protein translocase protein TatA
VDRRLTFTTRIRSALRSVGKGEATPNRRFNVFAGFGPTELIIVLVIVLLIFGPKRLPGLGRQVGGALREFKESVTGRDDDEDDDRRKAGAALGRPEGEPDVTPADTARAPDATPADPARERTPQS